MGLRKTRQAEELHTSREEDSRADVWLPPSTLNAPPEREGFRQRWIATSIQGTAQPHHVARRFNEGWVPRKADTVPEGFTAPTIGHGEFEGCIMVEGMILCEMPIERVNARTRYFKKKTGELGDFTKAALSRTAASGGIPIDQEHTRSFTRGPGRVAED